MIKNGRLVGGFVKKYGQPEADLEKQSTTQFLTGLYVTHNAPMVMQLWLLHDDAFIWVVNIFVNRQK